MKSVTEKGQESPAKAFFPRKTMLLLAAICAIMAALFVFQEVVLRRSGYEENLYDDSPARAPISGRVIDKESSEPVAGATVQAKGLDVHCLTDEKGCFSLSLPNGSDTGEAFISIEKNGYSIVSLKPAEHSDGEGSELEIRLSRQVTSNGSE